MYSKNVINIYKVSMEPFILTKKTLYPEKRKIKVIHEIPPLCHLNFSNYFDFILVILKAPKSDRTTCVWVTETIEYYYEFTLQQVANLFLQEILNVLGEYDKNEMIENIKNSQYIYFKELFNLLDGIDGIKQFFNTKQK